MMAAAMLPPPMKVIFMMPDSRAKGRRLPSPQDGACACQALRLARPEDRGADAHHRRALGDRGLEVVATCPSTACRAAMPSARARLAAAAQHARSARAAAPRRRSGSGIAIRPRRRRPRQRRDRARERRAPRRARTPLLLASPLTLTWMQTLSGGACRRAAARDRRSAIFARSTQCTQSKCSATARVLLLWIGPMKCQSSRQVGERVDLVHRFLHVVLAEVALPGGDAPRAISAGRMGLATRPRAMSRAAVRLASRRGNARVHGLQVVRDWGHNRRGSQAILLD